ncbi:hypothetical protein [Litoribrevibacter albus]|nr:hypothetical protein [Litoribrevibacter albus]
MKDIDKTTVLDFIADLTAPIGPEVFAGFGSKTQKELAKDPLCFDALIKDWLSNMDLDALAPLLIEIACGDSLPERCANLRMRFQKDWVLVLTSIIFEAYSSDESAFEVILHKLDDSLEGEDIAAELRLWRDEEC